MKAVVYENYGSPEVLQLKEITKPEPKENEILVKVHASTVTSGSQWIRMGKFPGSKFFTFMVRLMYGISKPRNPVLGPEFAGVVEKVGAKVIDFKIGDKVFGTTTGLKQGSYAEYLCVPEKWKMGSATIMPNNVSFEEAAAIPVGAVTAMQILNWGKIEKAQKVLIYGASGSVGTYAIQYAKYLGAEVTGVCSTANVSLIKSIGADHVIDYTKEDFTQIGKTFDIIFDAVGKISYPQCKKIIKSKKHYLSVDSMTNEKREYLDFIKKLVEDGKIKPVIDKIYPMKEIVQAHQYADTGRKKGNVVIKISE